MNFQVLQGLDVVLSDCIQVSKKSHKNLCSVVNPLTPNQHKPARLFYFV